MENLFDKLRADPPVNKNFKIISNNETQNEMPIPIKNANSREASAERIEKRTKTKLTTRKGVAQKNPIAKAHQHKLIKNGGEIKNKIKPFRVLVKRFNWPIATASQAAVMAKEAHTSNKKKKTLKNTVTNKVHAAKVQTKTEVKLLSNKIDVQPARKVEEKQKSSVLTAAESKIVDRGAVKSIGLRGRPRKNAGAEIDLEKKAPKNKKLEEAGAELRQTKRKADDSVSKTVQKSPTIVIKLQHSKNPTRKKRKAEESDDKGSAKKMARKLNLPNPKKNANILLNQDLIKKFGKRFFNVRVRIKKCNIENYFKQQRASKPKKNLSVSFVEEVQVLGCNNELNTIAERTVESNEKNIDEVPHERTTQSHDLLAKSSSAKNSTEEPASESPTQENNEEHEAETSTEAALSLEVEPDIDLVEQNDDDNALNEEEQKQDEESIVKLQEEESIVEEQKNVDEEQLDEKEEDELLEDHQPEESMHEEKESEKESLTKEQQLEEEVEQEAEVEQEEEEVEQQEEEVEQEEDVEQEKEVEQEEEESVLLAEQKKKEESPLKDEQQKEMESHEEEEDEVESLLNEEHQEEEESALKEQHHEEEEEMEIPFEHMVSDHSNMSNAEKDVLENGFDLSKENEDHIPEETLEKQNKLQIINDSENELDVHFNYSPVSFESAHSEVHPPADTLSQLSDISDGSLNPPQNPKHKDPLEDDDDFVDPNVMYNANAAVEQEEMIVDAQLSVLDTDAVIPVPDDVSGLLGDMEDISDKLSSMEVDHLNPTLSLMDDTNHDNAHLNLDAESLGVDVLEAHTLVDTIVNETMHS